MAFYQDAPRKRTPKRNYANEGSWADEGAHYNLRPGDRAPEGSRAQGGSRGFGDRSKQEVDRGVTPRENRSFSGKRGFDGRPEQREERGFAPRENRSFGGSRGFSGRPKQQEDRGFAPRENRSFSGNREFTGRFEQREDQGFAPRENRSFSGNRGFTGRSEQREDRGGAPRENRSFDRSRGFSGRSEQREDRGGAPRENRSFDRSRSFGNRPAQDIAPKRFGRPPVPAAPSSPATKSYRDYQYHEPVKAAPAAFALPAPAPVENENPQALVLAGRNPIREALKAGRDLEKLFVQRGELSGSAREIVQLVKEKHIPVQETEKVRLDEMAPHHQGLVAIASAYQYATVEDMLALAAQRQEDPFLVLLDGVTDPHNLGAIIRTAECAGAHGVILPERRSVGLTPAAVKASAGAIEHLKVARVTNLNRTIEELQKRHIWAYAMTMDGRDYEKVDFKGGVALVIGAEGEGISRLTREICDTAVSLPLKGQMESLNASVAAGIMMYRIVAARKSP